MYQEQILMPMLSVVDAACHCSSPVAGYTDGLTTSQCGLRNRNAGNHVGDRFWKPGALFCVVLRD